MALLNEKLFNTRRFIYLLLTLLLFNISAHATFYEWNTNNTISNGLVDIGYGGKPSVFYRDNLWNLISGEIYGTFIGYTWNGTSWVSNSSVVTGLVDVGDYSNPTIFYKDNLWNLISGEYFGTFIGYTWNGTSWVSNSSVVTGLSDVGFVPFPSVFYRDNIWILISGYELSDTGTTPCTDFIGYTWNGTSWVSNSSVVVGLENSHYLPDPTIFYRDNLWTLISGEYYGTLFGYTWNGTSWVSNSSVVTGLSDVGDSSSPAAVYRDNIWIMIAGEWTGVFFGYSWDEQIPVLYYPNNNSNIYYSYPPQTTQISFSWSDNGSSAFNLQVAKDGNFNLMSVDTIVSTNYSIQPLSGTQQYWWKVRTYNSTSGIYGIWSDTYNFTLTANTTTTGTGIQGVVYELISGVQTPVNGASVFIYNTTWSNAMITGSNGYYLFSNLGNNTYYIKATKNDYFDSQLQTVNVSGSIVTQNILMEVCTSIYTCGSGSQYVKFIVQNWFGTTKYTYVSVNVFKGSDITASKSGTTGTDGAAAFLLIKDQQYTITFTNTSQGISEILTLIPSDTLYYIIVTDTALPWWSNTSYSAVNEVTFSVITREINATAAYINVTYNDTLIQTTALAFYINQTNHSGLSNVQTTLQSYTPGVPGNTTYSFIVYNFGGQSYLVNVKATHTTFGNIYRSFGVRFPGNTTTVDDFIPTKLKFIIALGFMLFIGAVFGQIKSAIGAAVFCGLGWVFFFYGWLAYVDAVQMGVGLILGTVMAAIWNFNEFGKSEGIG